jgi:hypothetical protein
VDRRQERLVRHPNPRFTTRLLAVVFAVLTLVLLVVVAFQTWMLYCEGWRMALGSFPEYLAALASMTKS